MCKRFGQVLLALSGTLILLASPAWADEASPALPEEAVEAQQLEAPALFEMEPDGPWDQRELFDFFLADRLGLPVPISDIAPAQEGFGVSEASKLTQEEQELYLKLRPMVLEVANGERSSTRFDLGRSYPAAAEQSSLLNVINALKTDYPLSFYWYGYSYAFYDNRPQYAGRTGTVVFLVTAQSYRPDGDLDNYYAFDPSVLDRVNAAARRAQEIADENAAKSDYEKLRAYMVRICELVRYDHKAAADGGAAGKNSNPWNLINTFDGDPDTNVVCAGYALSFQYLCDRTDWQGDTACYTVTGNLNGGYHMWNIVHIDGASYIVDVTGCDYDYSGSGPDLSAYLKYTERFFLIGGEPDSHGSWTVNLEEWKIPGSGYWLPAATRQYDYSSFTLSAYPNGILNLSPTAYDPNDDGLLHGAVTASVTYAIEAEEVVLTISPDPGYKVRSVRVASQDGRIVPVSGSGNRWVFAMPAFDVFVDVKFTRA